MLDSSLSRQRQQRLLDVMQQRQLGAAVIGLPHHVYYLTAHLPGWQHQAALVLTSDGQAWLATANQPNKNAAADEVVAYEANWMGTLRQEQPHVVAGMVLELLKSRGARRIGIDASPVTSQVAMAFEGECEAVDPALWQLRRKKDPDELALMKRAIACTEAMYRRARQIIEPGVPELTVFAELNAAAVKAAGEPLTALLGNDYASGVGGGPARGNKAADAGQIYVLDLGPAVRGYFSDNCRAFAVNREPTDAQLKAWRAITGVFPIVERMAKPGVRCRDIFDAVSKHLQTAYGKPMPHHLGHGVGLQPHEYPHLNPKWDDTLIEGEVFTAEPGLYGPEINGGIRIENQYLVTGDGVVNLTPFPMELA
jgi:Xaa-Pro aminopeptidase